VARIGNIKFACENPIQLAEFWSAAIGYVPLDVPPEVLEQVEKGIERGELDPTGWAMLVPPDGAGPRLLFQRRPKSLTESMPIHLDLNTSDREAEVKRLEGLGASIVETTTSRIGDFEEVFTVMRDPEGNGFCVQ
jgi:hypothetical protein